LKIGSYARPSRLHHLPEWFAHSDRLHQGSNQSRVLVYTEQGLGDAIQFSRWVLALLPQVEKVYFEVQAPLVDLMRCLANPGQPHRADALSVIVRGEIPADVSHCVSVMSLPARLSLADPLSAEVPKAPYLDLSCARQSGENRQIKAQLHNPQALSSKALPGEFKVGFVWEGGFHSEETQMWSLNQRRNIELAQMHRLFEGLPICLYSFQKGERAEVLLRDYLSGGRWCAAPCVDLSERLTSFIETSYFLDQMDLLITVDTAIAHLAGAMAKPVWLLNRYDSCWRWGPSGCETLWYPSMRLIRQSKPGNWDLAIDQTRSMLEAWLNDRK